jgi:hypothetical protein
MYQGRKHQSLKGNALYFLTNLSQHKGQSLSNILERGISMLHRSFFYCGEKSFFTMAFLAVGYVMHTISTSYSFAMRYNRKYN